jgi:hypothetical protein
MIITFAILDRWNSGFLTPHVKKSGLKCDEIVIEFKFWCEFERGSGMGGNSIPG